MKLDVTLPADVEKAVATAVEAFGRIDVLINNAGSGFLSAFEEMSGDEFKGQIDTNFCGVVNVTRAILPHLRQQGSGHIIQISSLLSKKHSKKELTKRPPFLVKSLVCKTSEKIIKGGWRDGKTLAA